MVHNQKYLGFPRKGQYLTIWGFWILYTYCALTSILTLLAMVMKDASFVKKCFGHLSNMQLIATSIWFVVTYGWWCTPVRQDAFSGAFKGISDEHAY